MELPPIVIPANAGIQSGKEAIGPLDPRLRGNYVLVAYTLLRAHTLTACSMVSLVGKLEAAKETGVFR